MTAPFGIEFYSPVERLDIVKDLGQGKYSVKPPSSHPAFETYIVQATPSIGIFWIKGISPYVANDAFGNQARQAVDSLKSQLEKRYGPGIVSDFLASGSIWNEPREWARSLSVNERYYFVLWEKPVAKQLPSDVETVFLGVSADESDETSVYIEYASVRLKEAEAELEDRLSDLL